MKTKTDPPNEAIGDGAYIAAILDDPHHPKHRAALKAIPRVLAMPKYAELGINEADVRQWLREEAQNTKSFNNPKSNEQNR